MTVQRRFAETMQQAARAKDDKPQAVHLETPDYIVRTMTVDDARGGLDEWLLDPLAARNLNAKPQRLSEEALRRYIEGFDGESAHLLGIFERLSGRAVGIRAVYVDRKTREFMVNVLVGASDARNKGARTQSRAVVYRHFFEERGLLAARATVLGVNEAVLAGMEKRGWIQEHAGVKAAAGGQGVVEVRHFRLSRESWRRVTHAGIR